MAHIRITIGGREYDNPEAMPPEARRIYEATMRLARPVLKDRDGNGIPDVLEGPPLPPKGVAIEHRIVVNGETYRDVEGMPPEVRALYQDAMAQVRPGSVVEITRAGPTFSIGFSGPKAVATPRGASPGIPRAIEPSAIEWGLRTLLVVLALVVIGGLAAWALLGW